MKRSLLGLSLCLTLPMLAAITIEESKGKLRAAQQRMNDAQKRIEALSRKIEEHQTRIGAVQGRKEYSADIEKCKGDVESAVNAQNRALEEYKRAVQHYQQVLDETGREHDVTTVGSGHEIMERRKPAPSRVITRPATKTYARRIVR